MQPKVFFSAQDMELMNALHRKSERDRVEYTLMGGATKVEGGFLVTKLVCPEQEVSAGYVEIVGAPTWLTEIRGLFPVWIHTHMCTAFWSGTDEKTICALVPPREDERLKVTVSVVLGRDKFLGRADIHSPIELTLDDLVVEVVNSSGKQLEADDKITKMFAGKIKPYVAPRVVGYNTYFNSPEGHEDSDTWTDWRQKNGFLA